MNTPGVAVSAVDVGSPVAWVCNTMTLYPANKPSPIFVSTIEERDRLSATYGLVFEPLYTAAQIEAHKALVEAAAKALYDAGTDYNTRVELRTALAPFRCTGEGR